jgi:hypothetical protein
MYKYTLELEQMNWALVTSVQLFFHGSDFASYYGVKQMKVS